MLGLGKIGMKWNNMMYIAVTFVCFAVSFYTCYLVLLVAKKDVDFTDTLRKYFGKIIMY